MAPREPAHLLETLDGHEGGQGLALALDDELVVPKGDAVEQVAHPLADVDRGHLLSARDKVALANGRHGFRIDQAFVNPMLLARLREATYVWGRSTRRG
jgi:hypothetical protein